jgi:hypothetical protein
VADKRIYGLNLAWHWQVVYGHVHSMSHCGTVCSGVVLPGYATPILYAGGIVLKTA